MPRRRPEPRRGRAPQDPYAYLGYGSSARADGDRGRPEGPLDAYRRYDDGSSPWQGDGRFGGGSFGVPPQGGPYGAQPQGGPYGGPSGGGPYGGPSGGGPYGAPPQGGAYGGPSGGSPYGGPYGGSPYGGPQYALGGYPPGRPPRRKKSCGRMLITAAGVVGALILAGGGAGFAVSELTDRIEAEQRQQQQHQSQGAPRGTEQRGLPYEDRDPEEWVQALTEVHEGVVVDWEAPPHRGRDLDRGQTVMEAPGVLLVDTQLSGAMGTGTGIVLSEDGLAVTNYHVVEDSSRVRVTVSDTGRKYTATVLGRDAENDIAVLQMEDAEGLETASLAAGDPTPGDAVAAVGNARGQGYLTSVRGEVLGLDRSIYAAPEGSEDYARLTGLIQTDADVVPGYSGGPMVDADGQVVAVSVAASSGTTSSEVDGFGIPLDVALGVVQQVLSGEETDTVSIGADGALGIMIRPGEDGVVVVDVDEGSSADEIGLRPGDVIVAVDGHSVGTSASRLSRMVNDRNVGERITVKWITANGQVREEEAVLQEAVVN